MLKGLGNKNGEIEISATLSFWEAKRRVPMHSLTTLCKYLLCHKPKNVLPVLKVILYLWEVTQK